MSNFILYKLVDACRQPGCPVCRVEQHSVERYLENQFYENVNSPKWRDKLRSSLGLCHEHSWLAVDHRLGDALGFSIIYRDLLNSVLKKLGEDKSSPRSSRHRASLLRQVPEQTRAILEKALTAITPGRRCPICEHRDETTHSILSILVEGLDKKEFVDALQISEGLCLPHLQRSLEIVKDENTCEIILTIHRAKMEGLRVELEEFIRKSDYREITGGFGREGDAWLRAMTLVVGNRRK